MTGEGTINLGHRIALKTTLIHHVFKAINLSTGSANCRNQVVQEANVDLDVPFIKQNYVGFSHHNFVEETSNYTRNASPNFEYGYVNPVNALDDQTFSTTDIDGNHDIGPVESAQILPFFPDVSKQDWCQNHYDEESNDCQWVCWRNELSSSYGWEFWEWNEIWWKFFQFWYQSHINWTVWYG